MLKSELARKDLKKNEKYYLIVASISRPCSNAEIKSMARDHGWREGYNENPDPYLKSIGALKTTKGWETLERIDKKLDVKQRLQTATPLAPFTIKLMQTAERITENKNRRFLEEAIGCMQAKHFRAAIVLSWVGALWLLYERVFNSNVGAFVKEAQAKYKNFQVNNIEDFSKIHKESDFLEFAEKVHVITKTERKELVACLDRRNDAGHPNDFEPGEGLVAGHIEVLVKHVFAKA